MALFSLDIEYTNSNSRADISIFKSILTTRSREHLKLVFMEYDKISNSTIVQTIKEDFYSDMQYGLLIIGIYKHIHDFIPDLTVQHTFFIKSFDKIYVYTNVLI